MAGLWLRSEPPDQVMTEAMVTKPAASNIGPKVSTPQYNNKRWPQGLALLTRQMSFKLRSMVNTKASAENKSAAKLTAPNLLALLVNCVK